MMLLKCIIDPTLFIGIILKMSFQANLKRQGNEFLALHFLLQGVHFTQWQLYNGEPISKHEEMAIDDNGNLSCGTQLACILVDSYLGCNKLILVVHLTSSWLQTFDFLLDIGMAPGLLLIQDICIVGLWAEVYFGRPSVAAKIYHWHIFNIRPKAAIVYLFTGLSLS